MNESYRPTRREIIALLGLGAISNTAAASVQDSVNLKIWRSADTVLVEYDNRVFHVLGVEVRDGETPLAAIERYTGLMKKEASPRALAQIGGHELFGKSADLVSIINADVDAFYSAIPYSGERKEVSMKKVQNLQVPNSKRDGYFVAVPTNFTSIEQALAYQR
jgi:hypothetical protein